MWMLKICGTLADTNADVWCTSPISTTNYNKLNVLIKFSFFLGWTLIDYCKIKNFLLQESLRGGCKKDIFGLTFGQLTTSYIKLILTTYFRKFNSCTVIVTKLFLQALKNKKNYLDSLYTGWSTTLAPLPSQNYRVY